MILSDIGKTTSPSSSFKTRIKIDPQKVEIPLSETIYTNRGDLKIFVHSGIRFMENTRNEPKHIKWTKMIATKYIQRLFLVVFISFIGLADLSLLFFREETLLHWMNDIILLIGAVGLGITLVITSMEKTGEI